MEASIARVQRDMATVEQVNLTAEVGLHVLLAASQSRGRASPEQILYFARCLCSQSIFARCWLPRKLQRSHVIIENVSAKTGSGAGFLVKGDADISVRN